MKGIKMKGKSYFSGLVCILLLTISSVIYAGESVNESQTLKAQFKRAYKTYLTTINDGNYQEKVTAAEKSYQLGRKIYGDKHNNSAKLALNLASLYNDDYNSKAKANNLLAAQLSTFEQLPENEYIEQAEYYLSYAKSFPVNKSSQAIKYYGKALGLAEDHEEESPLVNANIQLDAGIGLLRLGSRKSKVLLEAQEYFAKNLPENAKTRVKSNFWVGKYYLSKQKYNKAIIALESNLPVFEQLEGPTHPLELATHAFLINALERSGKSDEATKHCIAIGSMTPWSDTQEQSPLFRIEPRYPISKARAGKSGTVEVEFVVSNFGFVTDAKVMSSEGGKSFEKEALKALKQWRYAPKFEKGIAVDAMATVRLDFRVD
jgi:TonB family protein